MTILALKDNLTRFFLFILLALIFLSLGKIFQIDENWVRSSLSGVPLALSGLMFIALYVVITFFVWLGPKDVFRLIAALLYGATWSTVFVFTAEMINLVIFFNLSRRMGRAYVESKLSSNWERMDQAIATTGVWWIFFLRLLIVIPLRFMDLGFGLTRISLTKYFLIALIATPFRILVIQYFLSLGTDMVSDPQRLSGHLLEHPSIMAVGLVYLAASVFLMLLFKKKLIR